jgi:hypothetical protein
MSPPPKLVADVTMPELEAHIEALAKLQGGTGTQFDRSVVDAFCELAAETPAQLARAASRALAWGFPKVPALPAGTPRPGLRVQLPSTCHIRPGGKRFGAGSSAMARLSARA